MQFDGVGMEIYVRSKGGPTKEQVRAWLIDRYRNRAAIPSAEEIRNQLGWEQHRDHTSLQGKLDQRLETGNLP